MTGGIIWFYYSPQESIGLMTIVINDST